MKLRGRFDSGRLVLDPVEVAIASREYAGKELVMTIEPVKNVRTLRQNARHWGLIVPLVQHALNLKRPGLLPLNPKQVHSLLATAFIGSEETALGPVPMTTHDRDTKVFAHMDEQAVLWLSELGYHIPAGEHVDMDGPA